MVILSVEYNETTSTVTFVGENTFPKQSEHSSAVHAVLQGFKSTAYQCFVFYVNLETISLPETLTSIGNNIFQGTKVKELFIPKNVEKFDSEQPFDRSYIISKITVDKENKYFCDIDGVLYSKDKKTLWFCPGNRTETTFVVPYGVKLIELASFGESYSRKSIIIPPTVRKIKGYFGSYSLALESVIIQQCPAKIVIDPSSLFDGVSKKPTIRYEFFTCIKAYSCKVRSRKSFSVCIYFCVVALV